MSEQYPTWRYHQTKSPVIVNSPKEEKALGKGWADTPAAFIEEPQDDAEGGEPEPGE